MAYNNSYQELYHHGILGQKWGIRRYQNKDGTLTAAGKERYGGDRISNFSEQGTKKYVKDLGAKGRRQALNEYIIRQKSLTNNNKYRKEANEAAYEMFDIYNSLVGKTLRVTPELKKTLDKYDVFKAKYEDSLKKSESYVNDVLTKEFGNTYIHELTNKYNNDVIKSRVAFAALTLGSVTAVGLEMNSK